MRVALALVLLLLAAHRSEAQFAAALPALTQAGGGVTAAPERTERLRRIPVLAPHVLPSNVGRELPALESALAALDPAPSAATPEPVAPEPAVSESAAAPALAVTVRAPVETAARSSAVRSRVETVFYDVDGADPHAIADELRREGPSISGRRFFGMTEWEMQAGYLPKPDASGCAVGDVTVHVAIKTHLPRWTPTDRAAPDLRDAWDRFLTALDEHEHGHRVLAEEAAEAIRARLTAARTPACGSIDAAAQRAMQTVMNEFEAQHLAYDTATGHGRTQGAVWPSR